MKSDERLEVDYVTPADLDKCRIDGWKDILGAAIFSNDIGSAIAGDLPVAYVETVPLGHGAANCEIWRASGPFRTGTFGSVDYRTNGRVAFGCISLQEWADASVTGEKITLCQATERGYSEIFACLREIEFPHILRMWNYLPGINRITGGVERYRQFNEARQNAFRSFNREVRGMVPAACALGCEPGGPLVIYFIAGADGGYPIENPRQMPAYDYPPQHGDFSPTFARAMVSLAPRPPMLLLSGTSSIFGHETMHIGDVVRQTRETVTNIRTVIERANHSVGGEVFSLEQMKFKVYLRRREDFELVANEISTLLGTAPVILYLNADICRSDLLIEIEAAGVGEMRRVS
jgi:chorismate lyase / 3-hydroxybenzoate synthase